MTFHQFGRQDAPAVVLVHPSLVMWDYFEYVIPLMQEKYHLVVPALPGYDEQVPGDFTSVEQIAADLEDWLLAHNLSEAACVYGCSMGGSVVVRLLANNRLTVRSAVIDGGITPYQLPWVATRLIAIKDFLLISLGKLGGIKLLEKAFSTDEYSEDDLRYVGKVLSFISAKTIWCTFESCNNYSMPREVQTSCQTIEYWYARAEKKDRAGDIDYISKHFPQAAFRVFEDVGHGGLAALKPELMVTELERVLGGAKA